jgi:hypothetical protein
MGTSSSGAGRSILAITVAALNACADQSEPTEPSRKLRPRLAVGDVILVTNTSGGAVAGSLRAAVNQATGGEVIRFDGSLAGAKITLDTTIDVLKRVTIEGPADKGITISGGGKALVLKVHEGASLVNLTITEGKSNNDDPVGGILSTGPLVLDHSTVSGNQGGFNAGIRGDAITRINSTVANNTNTDPRGGAGIGYDFRGSLTLINSTVARNAGGVGIAPFGITSFTPTVTLRNSIIANNGGGNCVSGSLGFVYEGKNISDDDSCGGGVLVMLVADPLLGTLADNGGPTPTLALDPGSPAIDATDCDLAVDQRYFPRDARCDIGAFEFPSTPTTITLTIDPQGHVDPGTGSAVVTGTVQCSRDETFDLVVGLKQDQRVKRVPVVAEATRTIPIDCETAPQPWIASLTSSNGLAFENGASLATARTVNTTIGVTPSAVLNEVKLFRDRR